MCLWRFIAGVVRRKDIVVNNGNNMERGYICSESSTCI